MFIVVHQAITKNHKKIKDGLAPILNLNYPKPKPMKKITCLLNTSKIVQFICTVQIFQQLFLQKNANDC
jgi:hypothetical protein